MKIRSKLSITFLTVSLASIATVCSIVFLLVYFSFVEALGQKLEALASGQKSNVLHVFNAWQDQVNLVRSRTSLKEVFIQYNASFDRRREAARLARAFAERTRRAQSTAELEQIEKEIEAKRKEGYEL